MGIKSKQIDSLEANKITQNDNRMFVTKTELSRLAKLKTNILMYNEKDDFPSVGESDVLYVAKKDIYQNSQPTIYIYNDKKYSLLSGGSTSSNGSIATPYIRSVVVGDWVLENGEYKIEIEKAVHGQSNDTVLFAFVILDGEYVHVPYKVENGNVTFISNQELECEILITDLNKGAKWSEIVDKPTIVKDISVINGKLSLLMDNGVSKELSLSDINLNDNRVGELADLSTVNKTNIVSAINECFQNASNGKENIATAISGKGVNASSNDTFGELAEKIKKISTGGTNGNINYEDGTTVSAIYNDDFKANDVAFLKISDEITYSNELGGTVSYGATCIDTTKDKEYRVIGHNEAPYISVYKRENGKYKLIRDAIKTDVTIVDCAFSGDGNYLTFIYNKSPYISVFRRNGDTFEQLQVERLLSSTSRNALSVDISEDGTYIGVSLSSQNGYFFVLKRDGDSYNKLSNYTSNGVSGIGGNCNSIKFCKNQEDNFVVIGTSGTPYFYVFDIDEDTDTYTQRELNCTMPTSVISTCEISTSGKYILFDNNIYVNENGVIRDADLCNFTLSGNKRIVMNEQETKILVITNQYPYAMLCDVIDGKVYYDKKVINSFNVGITDAIWIDSDTFQCTSTIEPFLKEYNISKEIDRLNVLKSNVNVGSIASRTCCISSDDKYYVWGLNATPYINIYKKEDETYTKIENIDVLPTGTVQRVMFSNDTNYLYVSHTNSPYLTVYKRNGDIFTKLANPDSLVNGNANRMELDNTDTFLAIGHASSPYVSIYRKNGDTLSMLDNPVDVTPVGAVVDVAFSNDSNYLACVTSGNTPLYIYKRDGNSFKSIADIEQFSKTTVCRVSFSDNGKYLAIASGSGLHIYVRDGETFVKMKVENTTNNVYSATFLSDRDILCGTDSTGYNLLFRIYDDLVRNLGKHDEFTTPSYTCYEIAFNPAFDTMIYSVQRSTYTHDIYHTNLKSLDCGYYLKDEINKTVTSCEYSPCGNYFVMAYNSFPYLELYRVNGNEYVRVKSIDFDTSGRIWNMAYSKDGRYFAVAHEQAPFITMYEITGETFNKIDIIDILPTGKARGVSFSRDGQYLAVSHEVSPFITIYKKDTDGTFKKIANPSVLPTGIGYNCAFSKTDDYLAVTTHANPYYILYDYSSGSFENIENLPKLNNNYYATSFDFSNKGEMFAVGQYRGYLSIFELKNGKLRLLHKNTTNDGSAYSVRNIRFSIDDKALFYNLESAQSVSKELVYLNKTWRPNKLSTLREKYGSCGIAMHPNGKHMASVSTGLSQGITIYQRVNLQEGNPHIISERHMDDYDKLCLIQEDGGYGEEHNVKIIKDLYV